MRRLPLAVLTLALAILACNAPSTTSPPPVVNVATVPPQFEQPATPIPAAPTATPFPYIAYTPTFEPADCQFFVPEGYAPECGYLVVPENRFDPATDTIKLHVARFPCTGGDACQPDPVFHLSGGPGSHSLEIAWYYMDTGHGQITQTRDYIVYDQRGLGTSQPALICPDSEGFEACRVRWISEGIDLSAYNSAASAMDIQDLRTVLGYDQINLLGISYGTRLALTVMRDHPQHIRSVILDSVYPPQENLYEDWAPGAQRAFSELFAACATQPECNNRYPDLENVFYGLIDQLQANPVSVDVSTESGVITATADGNAFSEAAFIGLYRADVIETLPKMIYDTLNGDYGLLSRRMQVFYDASASLGLRNSVQCYEEIPFGSFDDLLAASADVRPQLQYYATRLEGFYSLCETWGAGTAPAYENEPVSSDLPTLIFAGRFDPITPPEWGDIASATLSQSQVYHFPHAGHWVLRSGPCGWTIALAFLNNPDAVPDSSCIGQITGPIFQ